jgi:sugar phosphate isomerase/epimerase
MKQTIAIILCTLLGLTVNAQDVKKFPETKWGWKIGVQTYTFKEFNFCQTLDKIDSVGVKYIECHTNMLIGGGLEGKMDYKMDDATKKEVLSWLKKKGMKINNYGVVKLKTEKDWKQLFEFGKDMGIETFTAEPTPEFIPLISKLCDEYKINVAIHNHPTPSYYWNPEIVLETIKGYSPRLGACADIGHWVRSGLDPVECLKKLDGHVLAMHMKDLNVAGEKSAHDLIWGNGVCNIKGVVAELKRQKFKGMITAEYEYNWFNSVPDVTASVKYLRTLLK